MTRHELEKFLNARVCGKLEAFQEAGTKASEKAEIYGSLLELRLLANELGVELRDENKLTALRFSRQGIGRPPKIEKPEKQASALGILAEILN